MKSRLVDSQKHQEELLLYSDMKQWPDIPAEWKKAEDQI